MTPADPLMYFQAGFWTAAGALTAITAVALLAGLWRAWLNSGDKEGTTT